MSDLSIDFQDTQDTCGHCGATYVVSRGSVYDSGEGASIYLAALHQCDSARVAHIAIAVRAGYKDFSETCATAMLVRVGEHNFEFSTVNPEESPWNGLDYLGRFLRREEILESPAKEVFFHIADHVVLENPTIISFLDVK